MSLVEPRVGLLKVGSARGLVNRALVQENEELSPADVDDVIAELWLRRGTQ